MRFYLVLFPALVLTFLSLTGCASPSGNSNSAGPVPTISATVPANSATGIVTNGIVTATFSEAMAPATFTTSSFTLFQGSTAIAGAVSFAGTTAAFVPTSLLTVNTVYTAAITTAVKSEGGVALAVTKTWTFTTGAVADTTPPTVGSTIPSNLAIGIDPTAPLSATFSEALNPTTVTGSTFTLFQGATAIPGAVTYSGTTATFTPVSSLLDRTLYTATITTAVKDLANNALATTQTWSFTTRVPPVLLGTAINFAILAKTGISTVPASVITGDIGISPAAESYITGFSQTDAIGYATAPQVTGSIYAPGLAPAKMTTAISDMGTAYTDAAGRPTPDYTNLYTGNVSGQTLAAGLYKWTTDVVAPGSFTISGGPDAVWIFQIAGNLTVSNAVIVTLSDGAQAKNVYWQVAGQATVGTTAQFKGIVLSKTSITLLNKSGLLGRALAQTNVALDQVTLTNP